MINYTEKEWFEEGEKLYGDRKDWQFQCPRCNTVQTARMFVDNAEDKEEMKKEIRSGVVGFSCIGRFTRGKSGCDWTLGGLLQIHEAEVTCEDGKVVPVMCFADSINL